MVKFTLLKQWRACHINICYNPLKSEERGRKMSKKKYIKLLKQLLLILLGNSIYALGVTMFVLPNGLIVGGTTGLALIFDKLVAINISTFVLIFNILMFVLGGLVLGKKFAFTTLVSTFFYPIVLETFQKIPGIQGLTSDHLLAAIYAGVMIGFGIGIVIKAGASTGGMDIPPLILNNKFGFSIPVVLYTLDACILLGQIFFANKEQVLYGILLVFIYSIVLDKVLMLGKSKIEVKIISKKYEEINEMIHTSIDRGSTFMHGKTGYREDDVEIVLSVVSNRELTGLTNQVLAIDPNAFMIVNQTYEVKGRGFTKSKAYK